jgi:non-ribosomal peptide synthetase component F
VADGRSLTFAELDRCANQLARKLRELGVQANEPVGICLSRSPAQVTAVLAVLKAGAAYLPLDPTYPRDRLEFMLADSKARVLVTESGLADLLPAQGFSVVQVDRDAQELSALSGDPLGLALASDDLAYVIYTSGSTGKPKGVAMRHGALDNLIDWELRKRVPTAARTLQ